MASRPEANYNLPGDGELDGGPYPSIVEEGDVDCFVLCSTRGESVHPHTRGVAQPYAYFCREISARAPLWRAVYD